MRAQSAQIGLNAERIPAFHSTECGSRNGFANPANAGMDMAMRFRSETQRKRIERVLAEYSESQERLRAGGVASGEARRRMRSLRDVQIKALHEQGLDPLEIAEQLQCGRTTVYESLRRQRKEESCTVTGRAQISHRRRSKSADEGDGKAGGRMRDGGVLSWFRKIKPS